MTVWIIEVFVLIIVVVLYMKIIQLKKSIDESQRIKRELYSLGENMTTVETMEEAFELILDSALKIINKVDKGSILIEDKDGLFKFRAIRGYADDLKKIFLTKEEMYLYNYNNFQYTAIIKRPGEFDKDALHDEKYNLMVSTGEIGNIYSVLSSPIKLKGRLIGVINIDSVKESVTFSQEDIHTMELIKNELELVIKNFFSQEEYKYTSTHDDLTGLYNRRTLRPFIERELIKYRDGEINSYFVLLDMDDFKGINDNYGHDVGDLSLIKFSTCLRKVCDESAICIRLSGDEFVVLFSNTTVTEIEAKIDWLKEEASMEEDGLPGLSFSYGIAPIKALGENTFEEIFRSADKEMYYDKNYKKSRSVLFND